MEWDRIYLVIDTGLEMLKKTERSSSTIWGYPIYSIIHPFNNLIIKQVRPIRYWSRYWEQRSTQNKQNSFIYWGCWQSRSGRQVIKIYIYIYNIAYARCYWIIKRKKSGKNIGSAWAKLGIFLFHFEPSFICKRWSLWITSTWGERGEDIRMNKLYELVLMASEME